MKLFPKNRDLSQPVERVELTVSASDLRLPVDEVYIRLDVFLAGRLQWRSRSSIQRLIRDGHLLVDSSTPDHPEGHGQFAVERRPGRRLRHNSRVVVLIPDGLKVQIRPSRGDDLEILYEDDHIVAVDKPPMLTVHPAGRHLQGTLIQRVHARYGALALDRWDRPRLCHRIDRETSGIVLIGKTPLVHSHVMRQFERRLVEKEYLAIVHGVPQCEAGTIDYPLRTARASRIGLRMAVAPDGLESRTEWRLVERRARMSLLSCIPHTGRQHQIRVHLEAIGHPVVGDKLYGHDGSYFQKNLDGELSDEDRRALLLPRQALHHHRLRFTCPVTGRRIEVVSPLAGDMAGLLESQGL